MRTRTLAGRYPVLLSHDITMYKLQKRVTGDHKAGTSELSCHTANLYSFMWVNRPTPLLVSEVGREVREKMTSTHSGDRKIISILYVISSNEPLSGRAGHGGVL